MDRDLMRRGGARASVVAGHHSLQLDIERLFSQRIKVIDRVTSTASADFLIATVIKVCLVACFWLMNSVLKGYLWYMLCSGCAQVHSGGSAVHLPHSHGVHSHPGQRHLRQTGAFCGCVMRC